MRIRCGTAHTHTGAGKQPSQPQPPRRLPPPSHQFPPWQGHCHSHLRARGAHLEGRQVLGAGAWPHVCLPCCLSVAVCPESSAGLAVRPNVYECKCMVFVVHWAVVSSRRGVSWHVDACVAAYCVRLRPLCLASWAVLRAMRTVTSIFTVRFISPTPTACAAAATVALATCAMV